jgi:hypothetical protein
MDIFLCAEILEQSIRLRTEKEPRVVPALAGRYDNPIPTLFLAPIDCSKITAEFCGVLQGGGGGLCREILARK